MAIQNHGLLPIGIHEPLAQAITQMRHGIANVSVNPGSPQIDGRAQGKIGMNAPADPIAPLQHQHVVTLFLQAARGGKARDTRAQDQNFLAPGSSASGPGLTRVEAQNAGAPGGRPFQKIPACHVSIKR